MSEILFVGGPKDGQLERMPLPLSGSYNAQGERYLLEYLSSGIEQHAVYLWVGLQVYELVPILLAGYMDGKKAP